MKISVITTAYNAEAYIEETLESVLLQRGDFYLEYIVIDAKSSDSTLEKIQAYKKRLDDGYFEGRNNGIDMIVLSEKDNSMYEGIAKGFKLATGDVVAYINADDFYQQNAFSLVCRFFQENQEVKWLIGLACLYNEDGNIINVVNSNVFDSSMIRKGLYGKDGIGYLQQESMFWRRELLDLIDYDVFISYKLAGDFYLWYCFADCHQLYNIKAVLSGFRMRKGQLSAAVSQYNEEIDEISHHHVLTKMDEYALKIINKSSSLLVSRSGLINNAYYNMGSESWEIGSRDIFLEQTAYKINVLGLPLIRKYDSVCATRIIFLFIPILKIKRFEKITKFYLFSFIKILTTRYT